MKQGGYGRKRSWSNLGYCSGIYLARLRKNIKILSTLAGLRAGNLIRDLPNTKQECKGLGFNSWWCHCHYHHALITLSPAWILPSELYTGEVVLFYGCSLVLGEPGSSVSIVSGYGQDYRAIEVRSPAEAKGFLL
jgi:hypothetical protein